MKHVTRKIQTGSEKNESESECYEECPLEKHINYYNDPLLDNNEEEE